MSKFLSYIEEVRKDLLIEGKFVSGKESSELPDASEEDIPSSDEAPQPEPSDDTFERPNEVEQNYSDREIDLLNVALQLYRNNPQNDIQKKNELGELFKSQEYEDLMRELISIADGYEI